MLKDERQNIGGGESCSKVDDTGTDNCISIEEHAPIVIDRWFDAQVKRLYGEVVSEDLPDDLLRLITKLRKSF
ncbi:NepR family anti-sigma factor [Dongia soli]|uniref:NepR family anti-sigma factor n=1 Tax=Dongia soli TaxID=600628 RepID=A0ABU5E5S0_9PROT|nr:NepR family anti-sigma factor [Dongia soli]MDY0881622.1 NepR family anti-sigma factor [Dongia soli]